MNSRSVGELVGMANKKPPPTSHPGYQRARTHDRPGVQVSKGLYMAVGRHIVRHYVPSLAQNRPARFLVAEGPPGEGKTEGVAITCSRLGVDTIRLGPAEFSGETENAGAVKLEELCLLVPAITEHEQRPIVVVLDDFDLSNASQLPSTEYTVNSQLVIGTLQHLCDTGGLRTAQGVPVPIVMTGNDFTYMRGSLLRPGRARFHKHVLSYDEKCDMVGAILGIEKGKSKALYSLVAAHCEQPLAFFVAIRERLFDEVLDGVLANYGIDIEAIEQVIAEVGNSVDMARVQVLAAQAATEHANNYL